MRRLRAAVIAAVIAVGLQAGAGGASHADTQQCDTSMAPDVYQACLQLQQSQHQQQQNQAEMDRIKNQIADLDAKMRANQLLIAALNRQISAQQEAVAATQAEVARLDHEIKLKQADIDRQTAHIKVREELLGRRVRDTDIHGQVNYLELIVTSNSFNQLIDRVLIVQQIVRSDRQLLDDLQAEKTAVQADADQLAGQRRQQAELLGVQQDEEASLESSQSQLQSDLDYEQELEAQAQARLAQLQQERAAINAQVAADQSAYDAAAAAAGGGSGSFGWPEQYGTFYITQGFGCTPYTFETYDPSCPSKHFHTGIDVGGSYGAPIYAADTGIVREYQSVDSSGNYWGYGIYVVMIHGNGFSTLYGHLSGYAVADGATVHRGQVIAYEGSTGWSTGPHLHFEIRLNNAYQNPCAYLNPSC